MYIFHKEKYSNFITLDIDLVAPKGAVVFFPSRDSRHHLMLAATASSSGEVASRSAAVSVLLDVKFPFFTQKLKVSYTILPQ